MSFIRIPSCQLSCPPSTFPQRSFRLNKGSSSTYNSTYLGKNLRNISPKLIYATSKYHKAAPISLIGGGKGISKNGNETYPWKGLETATDNFQTGQSIEDVMTLQEYYHDGGGGGKYGGGPGGNGGGDGSSGEVEDGDTLGMWGEFKQVMLLTTIGFVYLAGFAITKAFNSGVDAVFSSVFVELAVVTCGSLLIVLVVAYLLVMRGFL